MLRSRDVSENSAATANPVPNVNTPTKTRPRTANRMSITDHPRTGHRPPAAESRDYVPARYCPLEIALRALKMSLLDKTKGRKGTRSISRMEYHPSEQTRSRSHCWAFAGRRAQPTESAQIHELRRLDRTGDVVLITIFGVFVRNSLLYCSVPMDMDDDPDSPGRAPRSSRSTDPTRTLTPPQADRLRGAAPPHVRKPTSPTDLDIIHFGPLGRVEFCALPRRAAENRRALLPRTTNSPFLRPRMPPRPAGTSNAEAPKRIAQARGPAKPR